MSSLANFLRQLELLDVDPVELYDPEAPSKIANVVDFDEVDSH